ncbi:MAG: very short patch repair endonuclease [Planctomycetota bacterium]
MAKQTTAERSRIMAAVKSRDTKPELLVASLLRSAGIHYRRDIKRLPGRPDFLLIDADIALFVHGCWWHGHTCPRAQRVPKTNRDYWLAKIARNCRRDRRVARELRSLGYSVWTVWECQLKSGQLPTRLVKAATAYG